MGPNITHGSNFTGLLRYLLLAPDGLTPRVGAEVLGGTLAGRELLEMVREFELVRRLRPGAIRVVMHHSLSYATGENPSDENLLRDAERYLEHLGLHEHPFAVVRHADKDHLHSHLVISKIGFQREWWDARLDRPRAQIAAALVEREFGLVEPERPRMRRRIDAAWARLNGQPIGVLSDRNRMRLPPPEEPLPEPPVPAPKLPVERPDIPEGEDGILHQIRRRMETVPDGLTALEWVYALEVEGVVARPSMKGGEIAGWRVQLAECDSAAVKLSAVDRAGKGPRPALGWAALVKSGRVYYDPATHNETLAKLAEVPFGTPADFASSDNRYAEDLYPRDPETLLWDWQPQMPLPGSAGVPDLVERLVDYSDGPGAGPTRLRISAKRPGDSIRRTGQETPHLDTGMGPDRNASPDLAPGVPTPVARVRRIFAQAGAPNSVGSDMHMGRGIALRGPGQGAPAGPLEPASRSGALSGGRGHRETPSGPAGNADLHALPSGRISPGRGRSSSRLPRSGGDGVRLDRRGVESLMLQNALRAAERGIQAEALNQAFRRSRGKPKRTWVRTLPPMPLSSAAREELDQYVRAFFAGELRRVSDRRQADAVPDPAGLEPNVPATPPPVIRSEWDSDIDLTLGGGADLRQHPQAPPEMGQGDLTEAPGPQERVEAPAKGPQPRTTRPRKPT